MKEEMVENTVIEMWSICSQANLDAFNGEIDAENYQARIDEFRQVLKDFQRESFPTFKGESE